MLTASLLTRLLTRAKGALHTLILDIRRPRIILVAKTQVLLSVQVVNGKGLRLMFRHAALPALRVLIACTQTAKVHIVWAFVAPMDLDLMDA